MAPDVKSIVYSTPEKGPSLPSVLDGSESYSRTLMLDMVKMRWPLWEGDDEMLN